MPRRKLTADEIEYASEIFRDSIDLSRVTLTRDSFFAIGAPKCIGRTIHLKSSWHHFDGDGLELSQRGTEVLIHELGHVWQFENGGTAYIHRSLWCQFGAWWKQGTRNAAYRWNDAVDAKTPWERWNPEQQATMIEEYNIALRRKQADCCEPDDESQLELMSPFMEHVWGRFGAPRWFR